MRERGEEKLWWIMIHVRFLQSVWNDIMYEDDCWKRFPPIELKETALACLIELLLQKERKKGKKRRNTHGFE